MFNYKNKFYQYLKDLAAKQTAPGGGSAGALGFCLGLSLIQKALKYSDGPDDIISLLGKAQNKYMNLIDLDAELFAKAMRVRGQQRRDIFRRLDSLTLELADSCASILLEIKPLASEIKPIIKNDFCLGISFIKIALTTAVENLTANASLDNQEITDKIESYRKVLQEE
jgi:hypothetical protein